MSDIYIEDVELCGGLIAEIHYKLDNVTGIDPIKMRFLNVDDNLGDVFIDITTTDLKRMIAALVKASIAKNKPISQPII